jgi:hypothetical protein
MVDSVAEITIRWARACAISYESISSSAFAAEAKNSAAAQF